ncbi:hypothetical protein C5167_006239, partial [Papaver somniferum]
GGVATYNLKSEKLPTPAEMIQPRYDPEQITQQQQRQPMYEIRLRLAKAKQASWWTILVQPRYKWRFFRNHHKKLKKSTTCLHQNKLKNHQKKLKNHQNLRLVFQNYYGQTVLVKYKLAADKCVDDSDKAAFLGWSNNVKQELERHNSFFQQ